MNRYGVSNSAGQRGNKRFVVWDRHMHRVSSYHRTFQQAQKQAWAMNRAPAEPDAEARKLDVVDRASWQV